MKRFRRLECIAYASVQSNVVSFGRNMLIQKRGLLHIVHLHKLPIHESNEHQ